MRKITVVTICTVILAFAVHFTACAQGKTRKLPEPGTQAEETSERTSSGSETADDGAGCTSTEARFARDILHPIILPDCVSCHGLNGAAKSSSFLIPIEVGTQPSAVTTLRRIQLNESLTVWSRYASHAGDLVALLSSSELHGGGALISAGDEKAQAITNFSAFLAQPSDCIRLSSTLTSPPFQTPKAIPLEDQQWCSELRDAYQRTLGPVIANRCASCHDQSSSSLKLLPKSLPSEEVSGARYSAVVSYLISSDEAKERILSKPLGQLGHAGGAILMESSGEAAQLRSWIESATSSQARAERLKNCSLLLSGAAQSDHGKQQ